MQDEEWGPWIEHDGKGCPCFGQYIQIELSGEPVTVPPYYRMLAPRIAEGVVPHGSIVGAWSAVGWPLVIRYRIRKPRALLDMIERARELDDAPEGPRHVKHKETAK